MSTRDLELELRRWRGDAGTPRSNARSLSVEQALGFRNEGNLPDDLDRSLRLVLWVEDPADLARLSEKRLLYEPDFQDAPDWRREGSRPVNVVPLRPEGVFGPQSGPWWDDPAMAQLESEWNRSGAVAGVKVPADYRGFVHKTVLSLRATGKPISVDAIVDSVSRWLRPKELREFERALRDANPGDGRSDLD
ncbi:MAG: hypothetical protein M3280_05685 [Actinomycetota bacterium]|nr:hypothetical protein [Actinomycetota bacterium]